MSTAKPAGSLRSRLLRLAVPNALSNLTVPIAGLVDVAMLGHLGDIRHLAGVHLAAVLFDYVYWSFGFLKMGTQGLAAQAVGRDDRDEVFFVLARSLALALTIALVILVLRHPIEHGGFALLSGAEGVEQAGRAYFDARIWGALAALPNFVFIGWFLARERSGYVLLMTLVASALNILLDYLFIYRMGLASYGAGLATMASQFAMLGTALSLLLRDFRNGSVAVVTRAGALSEVFAPRMFASLLRLNRDIMIRTFCLITAFAVFTNLSALLGTLVLAANAVLLRLLSVAAYFIDGLAFATESLAGILKGQRDEAGLRRLVRMSLVGGEALAVAVMIVLLLFPDAIYALMTSHDDLVIRIREYDGWLHATLVFAAIAYIYDGLFIGLTEGRMLRNAMAVSLIGVFVPVALAGAALGSNHVLWFALVVFMMARAATLALQQHRAVTMGLAHPPIG